MQARPVRARTAHPLRSRAIEVPGIDQALKRRIGVVAIAHRYRIAMAARIVLPRAACAAVRQPILQQADQPGDILGTRDPAMVHRFAALLQGPGQRCRRQSGLFAVFEEGAKVRQLLPQLRGVARGHREQLRSVRIDEGRLRRFLDDEVRIRAAGAERGDAGDARQPASVDDRRVPRPQGLVDHERRAGEVDVWIESRGMQRRHDLAMAQLQQHLGQACDAGGGLGVTDVRLDRTDGAEARVGRAFLEDPGQRRDLDRVAQPGAGAVGFDVADVAWIDLGIAQRLADRAGLRLRIGHGETVGLAAMAQRSTADDRMDAVAVALGVGQALEHDHAHALARDVAIAALAEALAMAVPGDELPGAEHQVLVGMDRDVHATGDAQCRAPEAQVLACEVDGRERG